MTEVCELSLASIARKIEARAISPVEVLEACLARIDSSEGVINAYVRVLTESARADAKRAENEISNGGWKGPLHGVPVALKDIYDLAGVPTTASSRIRENWIPKNDSAVVTRLKAAGAVIVGKAHTHEFACGAITPTTRNPWDSQCSPGGSSGGSGATVAACGVYMAMGTDTAGSIRIPAALCGAVGLKPTYGRVSCNGVTPLAWSLDHPGPLARMVEDTAISLHALAGYDRRDPGSVAETVPDFRAGFGTDLKGLRVGVPANHFFEHIDKEVAEAVQTVYRQYEALGAELVEVIIPMAEKIGPTVFAILLPEASAYHKDMLRHSAHLYNEDVRMFLEAGELIPATDYIRAQRVRYKIKQSCRTLFEQVDVLVTPSTPTPALPPDTQTVTWDDGYEEPVSEAYARYTMLADVTGLPALSVPCGLTSRGLPIGFQVIGGPLEEGTILHAGAAYQEVTQWHEHHPRPG